MPNPVVSHHDYLSAQRILNLPPAIAPGQPLTFEQGSNPYAAYEGGLYCEVGPQTTTGIWLLGGGVTTVGTVNTPNLSLGNQRGTTRRTSILSATTAANLIGTRLAHLMCFRGDAAGYGGFRYKLRFGLATTVAGNRGFFGLQDSIAAPTNVDPLTSTAGNKIGLGFNVDTGNLQLIYNAAGAAPTVINLGSNFSINLNDVWALELKCLEFADSIDWAVTKAGSTAIASGTLTTNIPANNIFMAPYMWMSNNATAAAVRYDLVGWRLTSKNG